jgi:glutathionylspermidine synthase
MRRVAVPPRPDWQAKLEALDFHGWMRADGTAYWVEDAAYELSEADVEQLYEGAVAVDALIAEEVAAVMADAGRWARLGCPQTLYRLAAASFERGDPSLYGRFDFAWDGEGPPKLLEYNADTPTALYETAVVQWRWLIDRDPNADQFNSIHERLIAAWRGLGKAVPAHGVHFAAFGQETDDAATIAYMAECAAQAGLRTRTIEMEDIGLNAGRLVDLEGRPITHMFKLYPWEWMAQEEADFLAAIEECGVGVLEPPWRLAASSKLLLADLWERAPQHPNLVAAARTEGVIRGDHFVKPAFGREGANVRLIGQDAVANPGPFGGQPEVYHARAPTMRSEGGYSVFGVWVVAGEPCGLGIREDDGPITGEGARFAPHRIA